jgi:hypothetical protein
MPAAHPIRFLLLATALAGASGAWSQTGSQTLRVAGRDYTLPSATPVLIDGQPGVLADLIDRPGGMRMTWIPEPTRGAPALVFSYSVIGTVTSTAPLRVLGQPVTITADTVLEGIDDPGALEVGTPLVIAGLADVNGGLLATLVERRGAQGNRYLLSGHVQQLQAAPPRLRLGEQWLAIGAVAFEGCAAAMPAVGDYVELRADSIPGFQPGDLIDTLTSARCATPVPAGTPGAQGALEGLVATVGPGQHFTFGALDIAWTAATVFEFGGPDDLEPGADVGVEGVYVDAGQFIADAVEFVRPVVRFEAPMTPAQVSPGVALAPFGATVRHSSQVRDDDGILANGLAQPRQVRVRGWIDRLGDRYATRVRDRGAPDPADTALRGPVAVIAPPLLVVESLTVDTTGAVFLDVDEQPLTAEAFFDQVRPNHMVDLSAAAWDAASTTLSGGTLILLGYEHTQPLPGIPGSIVAGTAHGYGIGDPIFGDGFDAAR